MKALIAIVFLILGLSFGAFAADPYIVVLGIGQDAGVPQMGCTTPFCQRAWRDASLRQTVSSIALVDPDSSSRWIFDATPDLPAQFEMLKAISGDRTNNISGIFLTHAHIGHYTGLMFLGRESMGTKNVPVFAMPRMKLMLEQNAPWSQLVSLNNISIVPIDDHKRVELTNGLAVEPFLVPHRDEFSETVGFRISSGKATVIFLPDIDKWEKWGTPLADLVRSADHLLLDGTFYADGEINRPMSEVPHPFVEETMSLLGTLPLSERSKVIFTHFNHSNPLVQKNKAKLAEVKRKGFRVAASGMKIRM